MVLVAVAVLAAVLSARQMILDIVGYLLADGRQLKHLILDDRIVGLLGKLPIHHRLVSRGGLTMSALEGRTDMPFKWRHFRV
jgi:hypothetical protein